MYRDDCEGFTFRVGRAGQRKCERALEILTNGEMEEKRQRI